MKELNSSSACNNFVLKGGTALHLCYGSDRFSEDIDLDGIKHVSLEKVIRDGCKSVGVKCDVVVVKDTDTVTRYSVRFDKSHPLKVEVSYRNSGALKSGGLEIACVNGIRVYTLDSMFPMKVSAFKNRDAARDFYDICWYVKNLGVGEKVAYDILSAVEAKGLDDLVAMMKEDLTVMSDMDYEEMALELIETLELVGGVT